MRPISFLHVKQRLLGSFVLFLFQLGTLLLFVDRWWPSFNGLGPWLWVSMLVSSAIMAALSTVRESYRVEAERRPVTEASSRSREKIGLSHWGADMLTLAIIPTGVLIIGSYTAVSLVGNGYRDWGYPAYALLFGVVAVLLGKAVAQVFPGRVIAPILSFFLTVFAWMYSIVTGGSVGSWILFDRGALVFALFLILVLFVGLSASLWTRGRLPAVASSGALMISVALIFLGGSIHVYNTPREPIAAPACATVGQDEVCVWPEDEPLLPGLMDQLERTQALESAAGIDRQALVFAAPGYDGRRWGEDRMTIVPDSVEASLLSAQGFLVPATETHTGFPTCVDGNSSIEEIDLRFQVENLMSAYVVGDMADESWSTSNPEMDEWRIELGRELMGWPESERVTWLGERLAHYNEHCEFSGEIGR